MTRSMKTSWLLMALLLLGLAACGAKATPTPTADPNLVYTQIWQTVEAAQTETAQAVPPTETPTNTMAASPTTEMTNTPLISNTPAVGSSTNTPFTLPTLGSTQQAGCDNYTFIADVTIPDGTVIPAGSSFVKTWSFKNNGPCTWDEDYRIIFGWGGTGTNWNAISPVAFNKIVLPGETMEISVTLLAPAEAGTYSAAFRLQNDKGFNFGTYLTVVIEVK